MTSSAFVYARQQEKRRVKKADTQEDSESRTYKPEYSEEERKEEVEEGQSQPVGEDEDPELVELE